MRVYKGQESRKALQNAQGNGIVQHELTEAELQLIQESSRCQKNM